MSENEKINERITLGKTIIEGGGRNRQEIFSCDNDTTAEGAS